MLIYILLFLALFIILFVILKKKTIEGIGFTETTIQPMSTTNEKEKNVTWDPNQKKNVNTNSNSVSSTTSSAWNSYAMSTQRINRDDTKWQGVKFKVWKNASLMLGLGSRNAWSKRWHYRDIDYSLYSSGGRPNAYEKNRFYRGPHNAQYNANNEMAVRVKGDVVQYLVNNNVFHTSKKRPSYPLYVKVALANSYGGAKDVKIYRQTPLNICGSDCMNDDDNCGGNLKCFQYTTTGVFPTGCVEGTASNQKFEKNRGYCYDEVKAKQNDAMAKDITNQLAKANKEIKDILSPGDGFTGSMKKGFFGFKHSLIEGNSDPVLLTAGEIKTKFAEIDTALKMADEASKEAKDKIGDLLPTTAENEMHYIDPIFELYETVYKIIIGELPNKFNFLASTIGFNIDNEVKLIKYVDRIEEGYRNSKRQGVWGESIKKLKASIFALKIIKWQISDNYIKYFKQANEAINNGSEKALSDFDSITYNNDIKNGSDGETLDFHFKLKEGEFNTILTEVRNKVQDKMMKKLNELLEIPGGHETAAANLAAYIIYKFQIFSGDRLTKCKAVCLKNQKDNLNCTGCGEISPFKNEINFILHPPLKSADMDKLTKNYIFIYNKSKKDTGTNIIYYAGDTIKQLASTNDSAAPRGAYIKCELDDDEYKLLPGSEEISIYWKGGNTDPNYDSVISGDYYRPKYPLWGFTDIDSPTFTPTTEAATTTATTEATTATATQGFTNMGDLMKSTGLVQTFNNIKQNRFNDVFSFFKNNAFKTGIIEGNDDNTDKLIGDDTANIYLVGYETGLTRYIQQILVKDKDSSSRHKWFKYVFNAKEGETDGNEKTLLNEILRKIADNKANIYPTAAISSGITNQNAIQGTTSTPPKSIKEQIFKIPPGKWDETIINLYVNDDGDSFITTETRESCKNNICPNGEPQTNEQDEAGLINDVMSKLVSIKRNTNLKSYYDFIHNSSSETISQFVKSTTDPNTIDCPSCIYKMIGNGRSLLITRKGMFRVEYKDMVCPPGDNGFSKIGDEIGNRQQCGGVKYDTNCRLNYVESNSVKEIPRCYEADGITLNTELAPYLKNCNDIDGMVAEDPADPHKCITDEGHEISETTKQLSENELRSCYLYNKPGEPSRTTCNPKKAKNEDGCLCKFDKTFDITEPEKVTGLTGKPIVEDSVCEVLGDTDLTYSECLEYARWDTSDDTTRVGNDAYFNIDTNLGHRKGCQKNNESVDFQYIHPNKRYGKKTRVRNWGENELVTLGKLNYESICKTDYLNKKLENVTTEIDDGETEIVNNITIPGIRDDKTSSGNYLITEVTDTERGYAKLNCDAKNSWDACYMQGNQTSLNEGERLVEDAGYSEFKLYPEEADTTEADTTEGFMGFRKTIREGATGSSGCLKNCAPRRFTNGNCDEDIKTTKTVDGIQRFFKMCPQECLGPTPQGAESNGYEDIDKGGTVGPDGTTIKYDPAIHGCRTSKQCEETCNKSAIQMKHVYDNRCNDEDCNDDQFKEQYEYNDNLVDDGKIELDSTIKITTVLMTNELIRKYNKEGGIAQNLVDDVGEGNVQRERAIFKFIEELKKKSVSQIIGFSYQTDGDKLLIIYKKANVFAKINITPNGNDGNWKTYIHKRKWEDYWYDPNRPKIAALERNLTEREMQRMQGIDLGISMDAFDKIPLYWQNSKTKEANFDDICEWVDDKIKAGELKPKDKCSDSFKSSWASRTLGIGKAPTKGLNFEEFEQVFNLRQTAVQGSSYTDMTNNMDIGQTDLSLDDYYKRNLLKSKVENRLGGSDNAYTKTYKPLNPDARPKFFNSAWGLFH